MRADLLYPFAGLIQPRLSFAPALIRVV